MPDNGFVRSYKTKGIVIRRDNIGEADRRVALFTQRLGKVVVIAKGARRPKSRLSSATDLFCEIEMVAARGRTFDILTEADIVSAHSKIGSSWQKTKNAYWVGEVVAKLVHEDEPNPHLYELLSSSLKTINDHDEKLVLDYFAFQLLCALGYQPELSKCAHSGKPLEKDKKYIFSPSSGGVVLQLSGEKGRSIDIDTIKAMRYLNNSWPEVRRLRLSPEVSQELHTHLKEFTEAILEKEIKSEKI